MTNETTSLVRDAKELVPFQKMKNYGKDMKNYGKDAKTYAYKEATDAKKKCIDVFGGLFIFFGPVCIFAAVYGLISFHIHYYHLTLSWTLLALMFGLVLYIGYVAVSRMISGRDHSADHLAVWSCAIFLGVNLAFFSAIIFGMRNYTTYMEPYYEWIELKVYDSLDPSLISGQAVMDAGIINFKAGSHVDISKSAGFLNQDMYCVAPIVSPGGAPAMYDYWAVGRDCCTGAANDFKCTEVAEKDEPIEPNSTLAGLRLLSSTEIPFYKLAVTQARTKYGLKTSHPIFVHWVKDSDKALEHHREHGWNSYFPAVAFCAVFQAFLMFGAVIAVLILKSTYPSDENIYGAFENA